MENGQDLNVVYAESRSKEKWPTKNTKKCSDNPDLIL